MKTYTAFLRWWLIFALIVLGNYALYAWGMFDKINDADITKISFLIYILFMVFSVRCGMNVYSACKYPVNRKDNYYHINDVGWFVSELLFKLGLIGTVIGFIYALGISFGSINISNVNTLQKALAQMGSGMSTALYTTAAGMICGTLLQIQLYNLKHFLDRD